MPTAEHAGRAASSLGGGAGERRAAEGGARKGPDAALGEVPQSVVRREALAQSLGGGPGRKETRFSAWEEESGWVFRVHKRCAKTRSSETSETRAPPRFGKGESTRVHSLRVETGVLPGGWAKRGWEMIFMGTQ
jgi:hypothetical protein